MSLVTLVGPLVTEPFLTEWLFIPRPQSFAPVRNAMFAVGGWGRASDARPSGDGSGVPCRTNGDDRAWQLQGHVPSSPLLAVNQPLCLHLAVI